MIKINLIGEQIDRSAAYAVHAIVAASTVFVILISSTWYFSWLSENETNLENQIAIKESQLAKLKDRTQKVENMERNQKLLIEKLEIIAKLKTRKQGPVRLLDDLSSSIPDRAWVTQISQKDEILDVTGVALDGQTVSDFMGKLRESKFIAETDAVKTEMINRDGAKLQKFTFPARLSELLSLVKPAEDETGGKKKSKKKRSRE
ncbi:MAG TPA: PilN domain-containing protein [Oligoflexia bacterium]|nr:PilN domain-containing protein [Oligoflexia bacterium]HMP49341.1 PilN domain-containing protein [Oligoflexia bacterium]